MPTGTEDLVSNSYPQTNTPSPLSGPILTPSVRRSHSYSSGGSSTKAQLRPRSMGVRFLSPARSKSPENLETNSSSNQNFSQLKKSDDTRQNAATFDGDNSDSKGATVRSGVSFSEMNNVQFVDLTNTESADRQQGVVQSHLEDSLQSSDNSELMFELPPLVQVVPASSCVSQQENEKSNSNATVATSGSTLVQTKLNVFASPVDRNLNTNTTAAVRSKYFTEKTKMPAISLSLEEPVTCARLVPLNFLKLSRSRKNGSRDEPVTMESDGSQRITDLEDTKDGGEITHTADPGCQETTDTKDAENRGEITHTADPSDKPAVAVPIPSSGNSQDSVPHTQSYICENSEENGDGSGVYCDEMETDGDTQCTSSGPSTCARLMPVESVMLKKSGQNNRIAEEKSNHTSSSPSQIEAKETKDLNLAEVQGTSVAEVIDLTHLVDSQSLPLSPTDKSPLPTISTTAPPQPGKFQTLNKCLQSTKHSSALSAEDSMVLCSDCHSNSKGSNPKSADSENILTPLPKMGSPKATDALYGKEPSQRSQNRGFSGGVKRKQPPPILTFLTRSSTSQTSTCTFSASNNSHLFSSFLQAPASKRLKSSTGSGGEEDSEDLIRTATSAQSVVAKPQRVLPAYLQPGRTWCEPQNTKHNIIHSCSGYSQGRGHQVGPSVGVQCVCGCTCSSKETLSVPMCQRCSSTVVSLNRSGLLERLSKLDLSSPEICQVYTYAYTNVHRFMLTLI